MPNWDIKKEHKALYAAQSRDFKLVDVPEMTFIMIDGSGDPNTSPAYSTAVQSIYAVAYAIRSISKADLGLVHTVSPLEGLWWSEQPEDFLSGNRDNWQWTMMIAQPEWVTSDLFERGQHRAKTGPGLSPLAVRLETFCEGLAVQFLHIGHYRDEAPHIARMHHEFIPQRGLRMHGRHHEIYLSDPRKTVPEKLKTIVRQPVEPATT